VRLQTHLTNTSYSLAVPICHQQGHLWCNKHWSGRETVATSCWSVSSALQDRSEQMGAAGTAWQYSTVPHNILTPLGLCSTAAVPTRELLQSRALLCSLTPGTSRHMIIPGVKPTSTLPWAPAALPMLSMCSFECTCTPPWWPWSFCTTRKVRQGRVWG
jgi:hypothetical protein